MVFRGGRGESVKDLGGPIALISARRVKSPDFLSRFPDFRAHPPAQKAFAPAESRLRNCLPDTGPKTCTEPAQDMVHLRFFQAVAEHAKPPR